MKRLILIGDSVLKGIVFSSGKYKTLENDNRFTPLSDMGVETVNLSKMGATALKIKRTVDSLETLDGDTAVLFSFGGNDSNYKWDEVSLRPEEAHAPFVEAKDYLRIYGECVDEVRKKGACEVYVTNLIPIEQHKFFNSICKGNDAESILKWLGDENMLYRWHESYSRLAERLAYEKKCSFVDLRSPLLLTHEYSSLMCDDGIHPTREGYRLIGETLCGALCRRLS